MMIKKLALGCLLPLVILVSIGFAASRYLMQAPPKQERSETVTRGEVEIKVTESGTIEPLRKVEVKSKAGGRLDKLFVDEGAVVRRGQILAIIDPQEIDRQVDALRAQVAGAQARYDSAAKGTNFQESQTLTGIQQFEEAVNSARARMMLAEAEAEAQPELTGQAIESAKANLEAIKASLEAQQSSLNQMIQVTHPQAVVTAEATLDRAKAQAENAKRNAERQRQLLTKGFVSQRDVDTAETDWRVAESQVREAQQRRDRIEEQNRLEAANARAQVNNLRGQVRQTEAALAQAKSNVMPTIKRRELENARAAFAQAKAQLAAARSNKTQDAMRRADAAAAKSNVVQAESQLKELLVRQRDTTLYASMDGVVTKRYIEPGEIVTSAVSSFGSGTPVFQIADLGVLLVKINVNEVDINKIKPGLPVEVRIDASGGATFAGHVRKVAPAAQGSASASSSSGSGGGGGSTQGVTKFLVEIRVDKSDPRLKPGMSARCTIYIARRKNVLRLPTNCVIGTGKDATVQIVTETIKDKVKTEKITPRKVTVGLRGDDFVEIIAGIKEGEKVRPNKYTGPPRKEVNPFDGG
jgi:HlyD family secretion protein